MDCQWFAGLPHPFRVQRNTMPTDAELKVLHCEAQSQLHLIVKLVVI